LSYCAETDLDKLNNKSNEMFSEDRPSLLTPLTNRIEVNLLNIHN